MVAVVAAGIGIIQVIIEPEFFIHHDVESQSCISCPVCSCAIQVVFVFQVMSKSGSNENVRLKYGIFLDPFSIVKLEFQIQIGLSHVCTVPHSIGQVKTQFSDSSIQTEVKPGIQIVVSGQTELSAIGLVHIEPLLIKFTIIIR
ncbi:hypothetical protein D3C80_1296140 [compost metagenome]